MSNQANIPIELLERLREYAIEFNQSKEWGKGYDRYDREMKEIQDDIDAATSIIKQAEASPAPPET